MTHSADNTTDYSAPALVEGIAHVVAVEGDKVWLEPEQTGTCGGCASSGSCGAKGIGTTANRLEARRFMIANPANLVVGERIVIGIRENTLIKASLVAYAIPLATLFGFGIVAQSLDGRDGITMLAMLGGFVSGLILMRMSASRMSQRGDLAPRYVRRAHPGETCHTV